MVEPAWLELNVAEGAEGSNCCGAATFAPQRPQILWLIESGSLHCVQLESVFTLFTTSNDQGRGNLVVERLFFCGERRH